MAQGVKTGGRKKGTPNKLNAKVKEAIEGAFSELGGVDYLVGIGRDDPKTFCALLGKLLPLQVTGEDGDAVKFERIERIIIDCTTDTDA